MKLSVIIPVYNVEKYIQKCILSVINNDLDHKDYEIIVVDDESPDDSVIIIKKMQKRYSQIKLLRQNNLGLGGARNTGIQNALGNYIIFLDADDFFKENSLKNILKTAVHNNLDILEFGAIGVTEEGKEVYKKSKATTEIVSGFEYLDKITYMNSACNKLYSVSFLNNYKLCFKERIFIEDFEFNTKAFYYARKVQAISNVLGCFVQTSNSITRNSNPAKNLKMVHDIYKVIDLTIDFRKKVANSEVRVEKFFKNRISFLTVTLLYNLIKLSINKKQAQLILEKLKIKKLYPVHTATKNRSKNLFRLFVNNEFVFFKLLNINFFLNTNKVL